MVLEEALRYLMIVRDLEWSLRYLRTRYLKAFQGTFKIASNQLHETEL